MAPDVINDKLSIKNMLFTKAIPNHVIPVPIDGHKVYGCTDCGDKFLFQSSLDDHVNRKSVKITYMCRHCDNAIVFKNRCNLLSHIRSHSFKTATINVSDLQVEPLPLCDVPFPPKLFKEPSQPNNQVASTSQQVVVTKKRSHRGPNKSACLECKEDITRTGVLYKDRQAHFMSTTTELHTCPICLFVLPTKCALATHTRLHTVTFPFYCPECGVNLTSKSISYPYSHDCEGFRSMRATTRIKCVGKECGIFHPSEFLNHMQEHLKKVYKCPSCIVACFNKESIKRHLETHQPAQKNFIVFYQCQMCPGRLVINTQLQNHLKSHSGGYTYPCWQCGIAFDDVRMLLHHHQSKSCSKRQTYGIATIESEKVSESDVVMANDQGTEVSSRIENETSNKRKVTENKDDINLYRVVKRCDRCNLFFTYRCKYNEIANLPNECPYKCSEENTVVDDVIVCQGTDDDTNSGIDIVCQLCSCKIPMSWDLIKKHYADAHKEYRCLDASVKVERVNVEKYFKRRRKRNKPAKPTGIIKTKLGFKRNKNKIDAPSETEIKKNSNVEQLSFPCNKCDQGFDSKQELEQHLLTHKDPCTAYQCLECGQCFVVKPSFSTHLLLEHGISDVDEYVTKNKNCYNEDALSKHQTTNVNNEPLRENQCSICRDQFDNPDDLELHFRVHGMAFLIKTTKNKSSP